MCFRVWINESSDRVFSAMSIEALSPAQLRQAATIKAKPLQLQNELERFAGGQAAAPGCEKENR